MSKLLREMDELFKRGGFQLHKGNSNYPAVLSSIEPEYRDTKDTHRIADVKESTKTLGLEWRTQSDQFHLTFSDSPPNVEHLTKRVMVSEIAKVFDVLGWFSPTVVKVKILLQRVWEEGTGWDDLTPEAIHNVWERWKSELPCLSTKFIPRCYYPEGKQIVSRGLHGFCDASEDAYAAVVYLRMVDTEDNVHITMVAAKTKVAPIKRLTIPRLELCGALLLAKLIAHIKDVFGIPMEQIMNWTDSTVYSSLLAVWQS